MHTGRSVLGIFVCVCSLAFTELTVNQAFGAQRATKEQASPAIPVRPQKLSPEQTHKPLRKTISPTGLQRTSEPVQKPARVPPESKPATKKHPYLLKTQKKDMPKAAVQPRTDLTYYGVLEDSQRYDPRPNSRTAGVPSPQTSDLTHDHFQELDRNQDGKIDPVERAFGRIDMDRDLHNRQLQ